MSNTKAEIAQQLAQLARGSGRRYDIATFKHMVDSLIQQYFESPTHEATSAVD